MSRLFTLYALFLAIAVCSLGCSGNAQETTRDSAQENTRVASQEAPGEKAPEKTQAAEQQTVGNEIQIADTRNGKSSPDYGTPQAGDVIVERTFFIGDGYLIAFYPEINGEVKEFGAFQEDPSDYDKAYYEWMGTSNVKVTLVNSKTKKERVLEAWADGTTTGIREVE